ncbi:Endonuclease domain-containing 1 protein [Channa argus]|uniref:Endonuclease domain-containing 1 protein n=1 Tax=Channa argus TaxID=215402 RepID=A0A6G1Q6M5_CHAAH|nr:Endonuclease domain-containing 1 protein [Channa argus]
MTSLKTWCLLSLSVLLLSISPTETEVVQSMSDCEGFLLNENPPQIPDILINGTIMDQNRYKTICQTYENTRRFVTLYDTNNKIPVFSAYKYRGERRLDEDKRRPKNVSWKIEPQLEERESMSNMWDDVYKNQAINNDYRNTTIFDRGHVFPCSHAFDQSDKVSTFTLTNVVPQIKSFNQGSWSKMESCVKCVLQKYCINNNNDPEGFVVTGAKPGTETLNKKVNIPSVLWSAFCCYSKNKNKWLASAHWGNNIAEDSKSKYLETKTLKELHQELNIEAFPNSPQCPLTETVSEFYPEINLDNDCKNMCPPQASSAPPTTTTPTFTRHQLMMLYHRSKLMCRKALRRRANQSSSQSLRLRRLCLDLIRSRLRFDESNLPLKEVLLELLNNGDLYHDENDHNHPKLLPKSITIVN